MSRRLLPVVILSFSLAAFAQVSAPPTQNNATVPVVTNLPGGYGGTVWTGPGPAAGVLLNTPTASFPPPPPTAGISDAGRAGISDNAPSNGGLQTTPPAGLYVYAPYAPLYESPAVTSPLGTESPAEESRNDLLPSYYAASADVPPPTGPSLAEIAARCGHTGALAAQGVRTYTNADVPRENAGLLTKILVAEGKLPASAQDSNTLMASAGSPQPPLRPTPSATQAQGSESNAASQTEQPQPENRSRELPASATILPLLGLIGLTSTGLGLWYRRSRR